MRMHSPSFSPSLTPTIALTSLVRVAGASSLRVVRLVVPRLAVTAIFWGEMVMATFSSWRW